MAVDWKVDVIKRILSAHSDERFVEMLCEELEIRGFKIIHPDSKDIPFDPSKLDWMLSELENRQKRYMDAEEFIIDSADKYWSISAKMKALNFVSGQLLKYS